jgi:hypothetical protein
MGLIRNLVLLGVGFVALRAVRKMMEAADASRVKVKAKANEAMRDMPRLKLDPVTGVYRPES